MKGLTRVVNKKTGLRGWTTRVTVPGSGGRRVWLTEWVPEKSQAEQLFQQRLAEMRLRAAGLPSLAYEATWRQPYEKLVERFLQASGAQGTWRGRIVKGLKDNCLGIERAADLLDVELLSQRLKRVIAERGSSFAFESVLKVVKHFSSQLAAIRILPYDPLAAWKPTIRRDPPSRRRAMRQAEIMGLLDALREIDVAFQHLPRASSELRVLLLFVTGSRPGRLLEATVGSLHDGRIDLGEDHGKKRVGACTVPSDLENRLRLMTSGLPLSAPLFLGSKASMSLDFKLGLVLDHVRKKWPANDPCTEATKPLEVALRIARGRSRIFGAHSGKHAAKDPTRIENRALKQAAITRLAERLGPAAEAYAKEYDSYCTRATHITLARGAGVNADAVRVQVGHRGRGIEESFYLDPRLVDPSAASSMVYDIVMGRKNERGSPVLNAENEVKNAISS